LWSPTRWGPHRTRLRLSAGDEAVVRAVGEHLGCLAGQDLAARCRLGAGDDQRADRKRTLTPVASSRWAGSITRTSNDRWERGSKNLLAERDRLRRAIRVLRARLRVPVGKADGHGRGRVRGYASQAERFAKRCRLQVLEPRLSEVEERIAAGRVSVCRGGRHLAMLRHALDRDDVALTQTQWRGRWRAERLFLTADGEAGKRWGNETIRVHPDQQWLEIRLPTPLAHLSNTPGRAPTYRLGCPVVFSYRAAGWAAQGLWVVAVDPAWTSVWGRRYWQDPLNQQTKPAVTVSRHHAAAVVIGRRGLGYRARRRGGCARLRPEDRSRRAADSAGQPETPDVLTSAPEAVPEPTNQGPGGPAGQRAGPPAHKTRPPEPDTAGDQAAHDRSVPPISEVEGLLGPGPGAGRSLVPREARSPTLPRAVGPPGRPG
jgi:hypothetical protein